MQCGKLSEGSDTVFVINEYTEVDIEMFSIIVDCGWKLLSIQRDKDCANMVLYTGKSNRIHLMYIQTEINKRFYALPNLWIRYAHNARCSHGFMLLKCGLDF